MYMNEEEKNPKSENEKKHELASAWSVLLWTELERMIERRSIESDKVDNTFGLY